MAGHDVQLLKSEKQVAGLTPSHGHYHLLAKGVP